MVGGRLGGPAVLPSSQTHPVGKGRMKIVLAGYYGFENVGDELLLHAVLEGIRQRLPEARPIVLSNVPKSTSAAHNVRAISRWNVGSIVGSVYGADRLLFGGGGIFQDRTSK